MSRNNIQNSQPKFYCDKDYLCRDNQNMKEVNSLSRHETEEQHKKNGDKEVSCRENRSYGMIKFFRDREKLSHDIN